MVYMDGWINEWSYHFTCVCVCIVYYSTDKFQKSVKKKNERFTCCCCCYYYYCILKHSKLLMCLAICVCVLYLNLSSSLLMNNKVRANINHSPQQHQQDPTIAVQQSANSGIHSQQSPMVSIQAMNSPNNNSNMIQLSIASSQQQSLVNNLPQSAIKTQIMVTNTNPPSTPSPNHHQQQSSSPGTPAPVSVAISSSSSSVVNEKTKTALANLLNNRLNSQLQQQNRNSSDTNPVTTVITPSSASCGSSSSPSSPSLHNHQNSKITLQPVTVCSPNNSNNVNNSGATNNVVRLPSIQ